MKKQCCQFKTTAYMVIGFKWFFEIFSTILGYILFTPLFVVLMAILVACGVLR